MDKKINPVDLERENEFLRKQLAELDELPSQKKPAGEGVGKLKGVQDIPTSVGKKIHAVPPGRGNHDYLDLYLLHTERERLVKETASLKKRRQQLGMKVAHIDQEMVKKQENARADMTILSSKPTINKAESHKKTGRNQKAPKRYEYKEEEWNRLTFEY